MNFDLILSRYLALTSVRRDAGAVQPECWRGKATQRWIGVAELIEASKVWALDGAQWKTSRRVSTRHAESACATQGFDVYLSIRTTPAWKLDYEARGRSLPIE